MLSKESEESCICVVDFGVVPTLWYFLFFIFFHLFISNEQQLKMKRKHPNVSSVNLELKHILFRS